MYSQVRTGAFEQDTASTSDANQDPENLRQNHNMCETSVPRSPKGQLTFTCRCWPMHDRQLLLLLVPFRRQVAKSSPAAGLSRVSRYTFLIQSLLDAISFVGAIFDFTLAYADIDQGLYMARYSRYPRRGTTLDVGPRASWSCLSPFHLRSCKHTYSSRVALFSPTCSSNSPSSSARFKHLRIQRRNQQPPPLHLLRLRATAAN